MFALKTDGFLTWEIVGVPFSSRLFLFSKRAPVLLHSGWRWRDIPKPKPHGQRKHMANSRSCGGFIGGYWGDLRGST